MSFQAIDRAVKVIKSAFKKLPVETLQKLGCSVIKGGDKSIVRANDDDIAALVHKSLGAPPPGTPVSDPATSACCSAFAVPR